MTPEKWKEVKFILEQAIEITPDSRSAFLDEVCMNDLDLRTEVESLLVFDNSEADALEQTAFSAMMQNGNRDFLGKQIGKYKIAGELGAGGMGAVFLAERADGNFEQQVALKLIKRGMDSDAVLLRFFNERRILASLKHPNIAHLIDGGMTEDDLPYFVMEYVEGISILDYAERTNPDLSERLNLFREVCAAVSFAHQNLVIHRDLKPSNILITNEGKVKLLDFGIAKLLKANAPNQTRTQMQVFTPEYASPEQIRGENLTTATDIYSLGVILYELLTGNRPYKTESKNIGDVIKAVCETEPVRPSSAVSGQRSAFGNKTSVNNGQVTRNEGRETNPKSKWQNPKSLRGDLDNIILKALRKEPERRYSSVEQFSEDIRRHHTGLPVSASRDTWNYRASKFIQRNRFSAAATTLILLTLFAGLAATLYQWNEARRERMKAEQRFNDVRQLANSFMFEINEEIERSPIKARELLVRRAVEYLDKLATESDGNIELESELAAAYEKIGEVQAQLFNPSLGKTSDALQSHQKSLEIRKKLFTADSANIARGLDVVKSRLLVGDILSMSGRLGEARANYQETVEFCRRLLALDEKNIQIRRNLAGSYSRLGQSILRSGSLGEALKNYEESLKIYQILAAENPNEARFQKYVGFVFSYIGYVKIEMNQPSEAVRYFSEMLAIEKKYYSADSRQSQNNLSIANLWLGVAHSENSDFEKSSFYLGKALEIQKRLFESDKNNFGERNALADCYLELGRDAVRTNKTDAAIQFLLKAIENYEAVWRSDTQNFSARRQISFAERYLGDALRQKKDLTKAREIYIKSIAIIEDLIKIDADNTEWQTDFAILNSRLGEIALMHQDKANALKYLETAKPIYEKLTAASPDNAKLRADFEIVKKLLVKLS